MWVVYAPSSTLSNLFTICTCISITDYLEDAYYQTGAGSCYGFLGNTNLIRGRCCLLVWLWTLWFLPCSLSPYCSFAVTRVCMLLFTWVTSWSSLIPSMLIRKAKLSCVVLWFVGLHIYSSKSDLHLMQ